MYLWSEGIDSYPVLYDVLCPVSTVPRWPEKISPDLRAVPKRFVRQLWTRTVSLHEEDWCPRQPILIRVSSVSSILTLSYFTSDLKVSFQKLIQKHICTGRKLKNRHENVGNIHIIFFRFAKNMLRPIWPMWPVCIQATCNNTLLLHHFKMFN